MPQTGHPGQAGVARGLPRVARALVAGSLTALGFLLLTVLAGSASAQVVDPCAPVVNPIVCENSKAGNPQSEWDVTGSGDPNIQGFATDISVDQGQTVHFKVDTPSIAYHLDIYRMGYYGGDGARKVATVTPRQACRRPSPHAIPTPRPCWSTAATGASPPPGTFRPTRSRVSTSPSSYGTTIPGPAEATSTSSSATTTAASDLLFQTSDTTWQAYNQYGGNSLYSAEVEEGSQAGRAYKVSYNRPFTTRGATPEDSPFNAEYPMVRFLERNGYDVSYFTGVDATVSGARCWSTRRTSRSGTTSTGRAPKALTSRPPATLESISPSSPATRSSGRPAGRTASTGPAPTTERWSPTRRRTLRTPPWTSSSATSSATSSPPSATSATASAAPRSSASS